MQARTVAAEKTFELPPAGALARHLVVLVPLAVYVALAALLFAPALQAPRTTQIGIAGDPQQSLWFWTWTQYALRHGLNPFLTNFIDYPGGVNLLWNTASPAMAVLLWPVSSAFGLPIAYDLAIAGSIALSAWSAFLLIRRLVASALPAAAGGLLYGFSPYMTAQAAVHVHAVLVFLVPVILILIDEIVRLRRYPWPALGVLLGLTCVAQFFMSEEVLVGTGLLVAVLLGLAAGFWPREALARVRPAAPALLLALAIFLAAVADPLTVQLHGPLRLTGLAHPRGMYVTDALNFVVPTALQQLAPPAAIDLSGSYTGSLYEFDGYVGVPLLLLLLFAAVTCWRSGWVRLTAMAGVVVALLSMGPTVHVAGVVHHHVPTIVLVLPLLLLQRWFPAHVAVLVALAGWLALSTVDLLGNLLTARLMLYFFLLAGVGVAILLDSTAGRVRAGLTLAAVLVAFGALLPRLPAPASGFANPPFFTGPAVTRIPAESVALVFPMAGVYNMDAMQWQAVAGMRFRMPEGYAFRPGTLYELDPPRSTTQDVERSIERGSPAPIGDDALRRRVEAELAAWHVETIVVGPMPNEDQAVGYLTWVTGRAPEQVDGVYVWWDVRPAESAGTAHEATPLGLGLS